MKRILFLFVLCLPLAAVAKFIPDPIVRYKIDARLDAQKKTITGHETIVWKNHTQETVPDLQFHLYLNAFKNNQSTFMREGTSRRGMPSNVKREQWGFEQIHKIQVDGQDLTAALQYIHPDDDNANDQTVARVVLPKAIGPGQSVTITIDWTSKMPRIFARTGYSGNYFLVAQWFPKPGVYEAAGERHRPQGGWNCHQFHALTEFFADYGVFDVDLTVPSDFEIGSSGAQRSARQNSDGTTTYNYYQEDIHDFAWVTEPKSDAVKITRTFEADKQVTPAEIAEWSKKTGAPPEDVKLQDVKVSLFMQKEHLGQTDRYFRAAFNGIKWFGLFYGKYPYDTLTVVDPIGGSGGMEYPTFITGGTSFVPAAHALSPEGVTVHEFGHQFWYALVGNNEFEEAWLDEGFNSYSTTKVLEQAYPPGESYVRYAGVPIPAMGWVWPELPKYPWYGVGEVAVGQYFERVPWINTYTGRYFWLNAPSDAMERNNWTDLDAGSYTIQAYTKPEVMLLTLEALLGDVWPKVIRTYHQRYRFKHPDAIDFMNTVNEVSGRDMKWFFDQTVYGTGMLDYSVSFTTGKAAARQGMFDENGTPTYLAPPKGKNDTPAESEVLVRRLAEMQFPVTVRVHFEDGTEKTEHWDGQYRWTKFKYSGNSKIAWARVDADYQWKLQVQRTHTTYLSEPVKLAPEKWYLRWVVWLQNALMAFSWFS